MGMAPNDQACVVSSVGSLHLPRSAREWMGQLMTASDIPVRWTPKVASETRHIIHLVKTWETLLKIVWHNIMPLALQILKGLGVAACPNDSPSSSLNNKSPLNESPGLLFHPPDSDLVCGDVSHEDSLKPFGVQEHVSLKPLIPRKSFEKAASVDLVHKSHRQPAILCIKINNLHAVPPCLSQKPRVWSLESDWGSDDQFRQ